VTKVTVTPEMHLATDLASRLDLIETGENAETGSPNAMLHVPRSDRLCASVARFYTKGLLGMVRRAMIVGEG
jgi:ABC-type histidine transport system ATPase subunit